MPPEESGHPNHHVSRRALLQAGAASAAGAITATAHAAERQQESPAHRPGREIWLASITMQGIQPTNRDELLRQLLARLEQVAGSRPDLICLPEAVNSRLNPRPKSEQSAEPIDGPTITKLAAFAKAKKCYIVAPIHLSREGKRFNTAVLLDRNGEVAGTYDKMHPTEGELKGGITPGKSAPVFQTDFGRLGVQICFDIDWADGWQMLHDGGAELVVWPAAYPGGFPLRAYAWTHRYAIVTSSVTEPSVLYDVDGYPLHSSGTWEPWITAPFCLERGLFHFDFNQQKARSLEKAYGREVTVRWAHDENAFVLECRIPGRTLADVCAEYGLVPMGEYIARAAKAQERANS